MTPPHDTNSEKGGGVTEVSSIGSILKDARTRKAVSLEEVHAKIKIHPRVLQLLEENKFEKLPSPLFVKSFLKSYAEFLEINPGQLLEAYEKEGLKDPEQILFIKPPELREKIRHQKPFNKKILIIPALFLAAGVLLWGVLAASKAVNRYFSLHKPFVLNRLQKPVLKPKIKSTPLGQESSKSSSSDWIRSTTQGNFPNLDKNVSLKLKVKALDNVWLKVVCDKKVLFQSILKRGSTEVWTATNTVEIWTGNSSSMVLSLNGFSLGSPGKGVAKKLTVSHQGVKVTG